MGNFVTLLKRISPGEGRYFYRCLRQQMIFLLRGNLSLALKEFQAHAALFIELVFRFFRSEGAKCECCVCGWKGRKFLPWYSYNIYIESRLCPSCLSSPRYRNLSYFMRYHRGSIPMGSVLRALEVGPTNFSKGLFLKWFGSDVWYVSFDLESSWADVFADIVDSPFKKGIFDFFLCCDVLEHVLDDRRAMGELFRLLRPGGCGIFHVPLCVEEETTVEYAFPRVEEYGHVRMYGRDFCHRLKSTGFELHFSNVLMKLPKKMLDTYGLESESIMVVRKPAE